jgi:hypothetical protein
MIDWQSAEQLPQAYLCAVSRCWHKSANGFGKLSHIIVQLVHNLCFLQSEGCRLALARHVLGSPLAIGLREISEAVCFNRMKGKCRLLYIPSAVGGVFIPIDVTEVSSVLTHILRLPTQDQTRYFRCKRRSDMLMFHMFTLGYCAFRSMPVSSYGIAFSETERSLLWRLCATL